jgi:hypothetical protein
MADGLVGNQLNEGNGFRSRVGPAFEKDGPGKDLARLIAWFPPAFEGRGRVNQAGLRIFHLLCQPVAEVLCHLAQSLGLLAEDPQELYVSDNFGAVRHRLWSKLPRFGTAVSPIRSESWN